MAKPGLFFFLISPGGSNLQPMLRTIMLHSVLEMRRRLKVKNDSLEVS